MADGDRAMVRMGGALVDAMKLDCAPTLLLSDGGGPSMASKLLGVVDALRNADEDLDDEASAKLAGGCWEFFDVGQGNAAPATTTSCRRGRMDES